MNLKEFGVYFANLREKSGYRSQRELADASGVSHSTINRIESGQHKATPERLKILAKYLKSVTYDELMDKLYPGDSNSKDQTDKENGGRAYFGGAEQYTEEELDVARAAIEAYRKMKQKK